MVASDRSNAHAPLPVKPDERQLGLAPNDEPWADLMRAIATFLVVCLHTSSIYNLRFGAITNADWNAANCINSITRVAVPMFFMLTGYFLLKRPISLSGGDYFKKRTVRIAIPLITWSIVYLVYSDSPNGHHITGVMCRERRPP